jgi:hypothetical protein
LNQGIQGSPGGEPMRPKQKRLIALSEWAMREKDQAKLRALFNEILQLLVEIQKDFKKAK